MRRSDGPVRIVGGRWRGRPLASPRSGAIRPTSDRLRETIFNILAHAFDDAVAEARVLDLFAGTGAMGLEALSRGASHVAFVESDADAQALIRQNMEALGAGAAARLIRRDATRLGPPDGAPASLVFCDPPYGQDLARPALAACLKAAWLAPGALVVVEEAAESRFVLPEGIEELDRRRVAGTEIAFGRVVAA